MTRHQTTNKDMKHPLSTFPRPFFHSLHHPLPRSPLPTHSHQTLSNITKTPPRRLCPKTFIPPSLLNVYIALCLLAWRPVSGYGTGAPYRSCDTLEPEHYGSEPQNIETSPFPYRVDILDGAGYFTPGQYIRIRLSGSMFRGFMLQVRDEVGRSRGMFVQVPVEAKVLSCRHDDDTITHSTPMVKEDLIVTWRAPDNHRIHTLHLVGTVLKSESVYWTGVRITLHNRLHAEL